MSLSPAYGKGAEQAAGSVDARTAKSIFDDAAYCDDDLIKDYYGGLLCGAKSEDGDDTALSYVSILKGMSRVQVKTHFLPCCPAQIGSWLASVNHSRGRKKQSSFGHWT